MQYQAIRIAYTVLNYITNILIDKRNEEYYKEFTEHDLQEQMVSGKDIGTVADAMVRGFAGV